MAKHKTFKKHVLEGMSKYPNVSEYLDNNGYEYEESINGLKVFDGHEFITLCKKDNVNAVKRAIKNSKKNRSTPTNDKYNWHDNQNNYNDYE